MEIGWVNGVWANELPNQIHISIRGFFQFKSTTSPNQLCYTHSLRLWKKKTRFTQIDTFLNSAHLYAKNIDNRIDSCFFSLIRSLLPIAALTYNISFYFSSLFSNRYWSKIEDLNEMYTTGCRQIPDPYQKNSDT